MAVRSIAHKRSRAFICGACLAVVLFVGVSPATAQIQLAPPVTAPTVTERTVTAPSNGRELDVTKKVEAELKEAGSTLIAAVQGNRDAMMELGVEYLMPAGLALLLLIVAYMLASFVGEQVTNVASKRLDLTLGRVFGKVAKTFIMLVAGMGALGFFGVETASIVAVLAAAGFAIGMALQGTLSNFAAGIMLVVFRPFKVGDYIRVDGEEGTVDHIELFTTSLNTRDNRHIILPNGGVFGTKIENLTHNPARRVGVVVGVAYSADLKRTREVLFQAVSNIEAALANPEPQVYLKSLSSSAVDWECRVWCRPEDYFDVKERVTEAAKVALDRNAISIPFPQLDLHVVTPKMQRAEAA